MSSHEAILYTLDSCPGRSGRKNASVHREGEAPGRTIPRIARLMALALRFEGLLRNGTIRDYAELARLGQVSRARVTQIMRLLDLAPEIQEQILALPLIKALNERNLRPIASRIDWNEQRPMFREMCGLDWQAQRKLFQQLVGGSHAEPLSASRWPQNR